MTTSIVSIGELLVEFVSHRKDCGLRLPAEYSGPYPSGAPAIFASQAALCGARCMLFGSVGKDGFGEVLQQRLLRDGVGVGAILQADELTTGVAFVSYNSDGSRHFIFHIENTAADQVWFDESALPDGDLILHVSGSSLGNHKLRKEINSAVKSVIARGGKISCDPNVRPELMQNAEAVESLRHIISISSILLPSTADIEFLYPSLTESEGLAELKRSGPDIIALKRGKKGASAWTKQGTAEVTAFTVDEVDPTGAGDCFCGTFLACLAGGESVETALQLANAAGALSVTQRGPMEGNRNLSAIKAFLASQTKQGQVINKEIEKHEFS